MYRKESEEAKRIAKLTSAILRPKNPVQPSFISAADVVNGLDRIEKAMIEERKGQAPKVHK